MASHRIGNTRRNARDRLQRRSPQNETLGRQEVVCENKTVVVVLRSNGQGSYLSMFERRRSGDTPRVTVGEESFGTLRNILGDFVDDVEAIQSLSRKRKTLARLRSETFVQGYRKYYLDVCQNEFGLCVKLTLVVGRERKVFISFPLSSLTKFFVKLCELLDECSSFSDDLPSLPAPCEVTSGNETFCFDVRRNEVGTFIRLSQVQQSSGGHNNHVNIPHSCWLQMSKVFSELTEELQGDLTAITGLPSSTISQVKNEAFEKTNGSSETYAKNQSPVRKSSINQLQNEVHAKTSATCTSKAACMSENGRNEAFETENRKTERPKHFGSYGLKSGKHYEDDFNQFSNKASEFWREHRQNLPHLNGIVSWKVYCLRNGYFGHYSLLFESEDGSFLIELCKELDAERDYKVALSMRVIDIHQPQYQKITKQFLGNVKMSGGGILIQAHKRLKAMGAYNAMLNNCQDFARKLSKDLGIKKVVTGETIGLGVAAAGASVTALGIGITLASIIIRALR